MIFSQWPSRLSPPSQESLPDTCVGSGVPCRPAPTFLCQCLSTQTSHMTGLPPGDLGYSSASRPAVRASSTRRRVTVTKNLVDVSGADHGIYGVDGADRNNWGHHMTQRRSRMERTLTRRPRRVFEIREDMFREAESEVESIRQSRTSSRGRHI